MSDSCFLVSAGGGAGDLPRRLGENLRRRALVEQAKGFIAAEHGIGMHDAERLLRDHAERTETPIETMAAQIVGRTLSI